MKVCFCHLFLTLKMIMNIILNLKFKMTDYPENTKYECSVCDDSTDYYNHVMNYFSNMDELRHYVTNLKIFNMVPSDRIETCCCLYCSTCLRDRICEKCNKSTCLLLYLIRSPPPNYKGYKLVNMRYGENYFEDGREKIMRHGIVDSSGESLHGDILEGRGHHSIGMFLFSDDDFCAKCKEANTTRYWDTINSKIVCKKCFPPNIKPDSFDFKPAK